MQDGPRMEVALKRAAAWAVACAVLMVVVGCAAPKGETRVDKRGYVQNMARGSVAKLYKFHPSAKQEVAAAPGYAVFDAVQTQVLIASTGNGYGLVHENRTGREHYMAAFGLGAGPGAGIKSQRLIIIFQNEQVMNKFIHEGWIFGASGTATAKAVNIEDEAEGNTVFEDGLKIYTFTDNGLMVGVSLQGGRVWRDAKLN